MMKMMMTWERMVMIPEEDNQGWSMEIKLMRKGKRRVLVKKSVGNNSVKVRKGDTFSMRFVK
jgi:hypothetical protein